MTPAELFALHMRPTEWKVIDGGGNVALYKDKRRADAYAGKERDVIVKALVELDSVVALLEALGKQ